MVKVVNINAGSYYTVYCGRPGKGITNAPFGNPFTVNEYGRGNALVKFNRWFCSPESEEYRNKIKEIIKPNSILGCFCKPNPCHCDTIAWYVNRGYTYE